MKAFLACEKMQTMKKHPTESDIAIGKRIQKMRKSLDDMTGQELADSIGVSRGAVGNWERGQGIKRENLLKIARTHNISFEWLATNRGDMLAQEPESVDGRLEAVRKVFGQGTADHLRDQIDALIDLEMGKPPHQ